ncbi:hypothetical protein F4824DRAFT_157265 [Ustulina deusta]|nr:hypothetical protein F4824DRAFT_157265 [Ustulina deusta]
MALDPLFWVLVRNYRLLETNSLVQSPNVDLEAQGPRVIIREINGEYMEEPRVVNDIKLLGDDIDRKDYRHAAHGVYVSEEPHADNFPVWVCLKRNLHCQEYHLWVLNLYSFKFLVVPISKICWVPSHEAANGELYTIISSPGKRGYKETRLPTIVQKIGIPEQAKYAVPLSSLPGLTKLEPRRQQEVFHQQYMTMKQGYRTRSRLTHLNLRGLAQRQSHTAIDINLEFPEFCRNEYLYSDEERASHLLQKSSDETRKQVPEGFCRYPCCFSDLGPTSLNLNPLDIHVTDPQCDIGSIHRPRCIFATHRPERCVVGGNHLMIVDPVSVIAEHQAANANITVNHIAAAETGTELNDDTGFKSLPDELEHLVGQRCFSDSDRVLEDRDRQTWSTPDAPVSPESRQISPIVEFLPGLLEDLERTDNLPDPVLDITAIQGMVVLDYHAFLTTPEPPEMCR